VVYPSGMYHGRIVMSMIRGNVQTHMAVFSTMEKWQYIWHKQLKKSVCGGYSPSLKERLG
jgi:hypothetical protein